MMGGGLQPVLLLLWLAAASGGTTLGDADEVQQQLVQNYTNQDLQLIPFNVNNSSVTKLVFDGNLIALNETDRLALGSYPALDELRLDGNLVTYIPARFFSVVPNLRTLSLARNNIQSLDSEAFSGLNVLTSLDLSDNLLKSLPAQLTKGLDSLQVLYLHENPWNCSCPLLGTIAEISATNVTFGDLLVTCASPANQDDVFRAAALCSTTPPPTLAPTEQHTPPASSSSQQPPSPTLPLEPTQLTKEQTPVLGNTWKFTACVAALAAATSLLIVCAVKGPSWYKLFHNYRHRRLHQDDDDDEGNFTTTVFSNKGGHLTRQTFSFEHRKGHAGDEDEEEEDGYFEDPYIKSEGEHAGEEILEEP